MSTQDDDDRTMTFDEHIRGSFETDALFGRLATSEVESDDRVVVTGPAFAWPEFERAYAALTQPPDGIVDHDPAPPVRADAPRPGGIY